MEQDSKYFSEVFNNKYTSLFNIEENKKIETSLYALGVLLRSTHLKEKNIRPYNPKDNELINNWDLDVWIKVTWGTDDIKEEEVYQKEFDEAINAMSEYKYMIINAIKYSRPPWAIFGIIGMMQGNLNRNQFLLTSDEDNLIKEDFIRCLEYLPIQFLHQYKSDLEYLFAYFDEGNYKLTINDFGSISINKSEYFS